MPLPVPRPIAWSQLRSGDLTVSPAPPGFIVGQVSADGSHWNAIDSEPTWGAAVWKAYFYSCARNHRVFVSRHGDQLELLDPPRIGLGPDQDWRAHTAASVTKHAPRAAGVYILRSIAPVFIGETDNLQERLLYHLHEPLACHDTAIPLEFAFETFESTERRSRRATDLIDWWAPPCNQTA